MAVDAHKNFAYSTVATAPSPATSGTSLVVAAGQGALFPTPPFNAVIWPTGTNPLSTNAEIVRVTAISTDTLTITRTQESTSARTVVVGDQIAAAITKKTLTDVEQPFTKLSLTPQGSDPTSADGDVYVDSGTTGFLQLRRSGVTHFILDDFFLNILAPLADPVFTGDPTAPTAADGDNDTSIATTGFVQKEKRFPPEQAAGGTADAITATFTPALALTDKMTCLIRAAGPNLTTTPTFAPNSLTAHTITNYGNQPLLPGDIFGAGHVCILQYNSTNTVWELLNPYRPGLPADIQALQILGSSIKGQSIGMPSPFLATSSTTLVNQQVFWQGVYVPRPCTITGVRWLSGVAGVFTANNFNGLNLNSISAGTMTQVAITTNDASGTLWKATANTFTNKDFSSTYAALPGVYFVGFLYCESAQTTAPKVGSYGGTVAPATFDFTNSVKILSLLGSRTTFPSPQAMSGASAVFGGIYCELY